MQIRTSLKLTTALLIAIFLALSMLLILVFRNVNAARLQREITTSILVDISNLRGLTLEYLLYPNERSKEQLFFLVDELGNRLKEIEPQTDEESNKLVELQVDQVQISELLQQLSELSSAPDLMETEQGLKQRDLLNSQISIVSQRVVADVLVFSKASEENSYQAIRLAYFTINFFIVIQFLIISFIIFYLFYGKIIKPLLLLERATRIVAGGNLKYKVPVLNHNEVGKLSKSFNFMITRLNQLDEVKAQFLDTAAHQLRSPLSGIRWNCEVLIGSKNELPKNLQKLVENIDESSLRMAKTVATLLDASQIRHGKVLDSPEVVNVVDVIDAVVDNLKYDIERKKISVNVVKTTSEKIELSIDKSRFSEIMSNLISNAVLYNHTGGKVTIEIHLVPHWIEIKVIDTGIGIPKKDYEDVFSKFYRSKDSIDTEPNGTGLGLFISKSHIVRWGGELSFESEVGKGTTFFVRLPRKLLVKKQEEMRKS